MMTQEKQREAKHEHIVLQDGLPFKMFRFEGEKGNYYRDKHWHRSVEIFAVFRGGLSFHIDEQTWRLHENEFMIVNSNEVHAVSSPDENETIVVQIPHKLFDEYFTGDQFIWFSHEPATQDREFLEHIRHLYIVCGNGDTGYKMKALSIFYEIVYLLVTKYRLTDTMQEHMRKHKNLKRLSEITAYMKEHYDSALSLEKVACIFGYSPTYLSRMFKIYAGITFKSYMQSIRIGYAIREMERGAKSLTQIASDCGFADGRAMTRAFKKVYGISPAEYKKDKK